MSVFDKKAETMPRTELEQLQLERLQALLSRLRHNVREYRDRLGDRRVESLADIQTLPATMPRDFAEAFPYGMFALPLREVIRLHSAVGAEGIPLVIGHTRNDLLNWGRLAARQLVAAGVTAHDVIQIRFGGGGFMPSFGFMRGAEQIEASVIPEDPFHIELQLSTLQNYRATVLITTPSNARELVTLLAEKQVDAQSLQLRTLILSRPITSEERKELEAGLFAEIYTAFGTPETLDPGLCAECEEGHLHVNEDHFFVETVDGELLVTTLCREAMPLLRYRSRLNATLRQEACPCGRTGAILLPGNRLDERFLVNDMPLYERQISDVLETTRAAGHEFTLSITERSVVISITVTETLFGDTIRSLTSLKEQIETEFQSRLGITADVQFVSPQSAPGWM